MMCPVNVVLQKFQDICTHHGKLQKPLSKFGYLMEEYLENTLTI